MTSRRLPIGFDRRRSIVYAARCSRGFTVFSNEALPQTGCAG